MKKLLYLCNRISNVDNMTEKIQKIISICLIIIGIGGLIGINIYLRIEYQKEYEKTKIAVEQVVVLLEQAVNENRIRL